MLLSLANTAAALDVIGGMTDQLRGRTVVNLTSGNPDEGRWIAAALAAPHLGVRAYIDGAYCGPPSKARSGCGVLFLSCDTPDDVERLLPTLSLLGEAVACGRVGSSRAIDYAVVDLALVCFNSFLSNAEMLEREGVNRAQLYEHMGKVRVWGVDTSYRARRVYQHTNCLLTPTKTYDLSRHCYH